MRIAGRDYDSVKAFYHSTAWKKTQAMVLNMDRHECQRCKAHGRYSRATVVHHVKHLRKRPDLGLSIYDGSERQLISLCSACHNEVHPEKMKYKKKQPLNEEKW